MAGQRNLSDKVAQWNKQVDEHQQKQKINPFSSLDGASHRQQLSKDDPNYGRPVAGSLTELRGKQAGQHISKEVIELCQIISQYGQQTPDGTVCITFGKLFEIYETISNKMVGMLIRARKQNLLDFAGEMLLQRRDDNVVITLFYIVPH